MNIFDTDEELLKKLELIPLRKGLDYKEQIKAIFKEYDILYRTSILSRTYTYKIAEEYSDTVIVVLDDSGDIEINKY